MTFDYCPNCTKLPVPLTQDTFGQLIRQPWLKAVCDEIAAGNLDRKRDLPAVCWQAAFGGGKRSNQNARPSGLFALDVDHIEKPDVLFRTFDDRIGELGIYIVHMTPSTHGLRVVARCRPGLATIADNQAWLAGELHVEHDACTRDLARLSFLVPESYFYHYDPRVFTDSADALPPSAPPAEDPRPQHAPEDACPSVPSAGDKTGPLSFRGVPYSVIVGQLIERTGGQPYEGERNNRLYLICRLLANITDRQSDRLFQVCPRFGLSEEEVRACCESACKSARSERLPYVLYKTLYDLGIDSGAGGRSPADDPSPVAHPTPPVPQESHLPPLIREFVATAPDDFKAATAMVCLPVCGFLGSRMRARYLDGELQAPSFIVNIIAPAASGKGSLLRMPNICLAPVRAKDDEGRELEQEYQRISKLNKNQKKQMEEPQPIVRDIPAKVSVAQLLKRMVQARGLHLISVSPEADTLTASNKAGAWAQKSDIYRVAQDGEGGRYGQDYKSDASFSATCRMRYNLLTLGTPGAIARLYPDVEDGLVTRCIMVELPSQFGKPMPVCQQFTGRQMKVIEERTAALMAICQDADGNVLPEHHLRLDWLNQGIGNWITRQQLLAVRDEDHARDQFMRRAALIAFRAGMVAAFLWGSRLGREQKDYTVEFALWVADVILSTLLGRYSTKVNEQARLYEAPVARRYPSLFEAMADVFTLADLQRAARSQGITSPVKSIIFRWSDNHLIEKQGDTFVKLMK
ncbi:MAG: BT4734/BF3469 family protein [Bacteroidaceae bacterium]